MGSSNFLFSEPNFLSKHAEIVMKNKSDTLRQNESKSHKYFAFVFYIYLYKFGIFNAMFSREPYENWLFSSIDTSN